MNVLNEALLRVLCSVQGLQAQLSTDRGQTLAEYSLILTVVAVSTVVLALTVFRNALVSVFGPVAQCVNGNGNCSGHFP